jgi:hypothetical protein
MMALGQGQRRTFIIPQPFFDRERNRKTENVKTNMSAFL